MSEQEELSELDNIEQEDLSNSEDDNNSSIDQELQEQGSSNSQSEEDNQDEDNQQASSWGKKKYNYYYQEKMKSDSELEEEEVAEAQEMQNKLNERLEFDNFFDGIDLKKTTEKDNLVFDEKKIFQEKNNQQKNQIDLTNFTEQEKIEFLARDSPELFSLLQESSQIIQDLKEFYQPLFEKLPQLKIKNKNLLQFIKQKRKILLSYYQSLVFYVLLKAKNSLTKDHPILSQIIKLKQKNQQLEECEGMFSKELKQIAERLKQGDEVEEKEKEKKVPRKLKMSVQSGNKANNQQNVQRQQQKNNFKQKKLSKILHQVEEEQEEERFMRIKDKKTNKKVPPEIDFNEFDKADSDEYSEDNLDFDNIQLDKTDKKKMKQLEKKQKVQEKKEPQINPKQGKFYQMTVNEKLGDDPRKIDKEILTHRGLIRKRKKIDRNSRVKLRKKFDKASVKQKYLGKVIRKRKPNYEGELTGIKSNLVKGVNLKN